MKIRIRNPGYCTVIFMSTVLPVEGRDVFVVKGQEAAEESVEEHTHRPDVRLATQVVPPGHCTGKHTE
jgi:hypothetical protein